MAVTIYGSGQVIVQALTQVLTSQISTTSTSSAGAATGLSISITPKSASNKIYAIFSTTQLSASGEVYCFILRNGTQITSRSHGSSSWSGATIQVLDSPATTSAVTYSVNFYGSGGTQYLGTSFAPAGGSTLTLFEVAYA